MKVVFGIVDDVGSHTRERDGQGIKVDGVVITTGEVVKENVEIVASYESTGR